MQGVCGCKPDERSPSTYKHAYRSGLQFVETPSALGKSIPQDDALCISTSRRTKALVHLTWVECNNRHYGWQCIRVIGVPRMPCQPVP